MATQDRIKLGDRVFVKAAFGCTAGCATVRQRLLAEEGWIVQFDRYDELGTMVDDRGPIEVALDPRVTLL